MTKFSRGKCKSVEFRKLRFSLIQTNGTSSKKANNVLILKSLFAISILLTKGNLTQLEKTNTCS